MQKINVHVDLTESFDDKFFFETDAFAEMKKTVKEVKIEEGIEKCPRCKGSKIISSQEQKRSADEGMTNLFLCSECGKRWQN